jgi:thymidylate synthase
MISTENLYQFEKYKVILGEGKSVGFCTCWNEPTKVLEQSPELYKKAAIIGSLYSRHGVNIIIRNLALNPQIRRIYLWDYGPLSCSEFGASGKDVLKNLWNYGIDVSSSQVKGTNFKLEKEIDLDVVEKIRNSVELVQVGELQLAEAVEKIKDEDPKPYMNPICFPEAMPEPVEIFSSELVGWLVRGDFVIEAWSRVVERIMRYGLIKGTQYGQKQRELIGVTWVITKEDPVSPQLPTDWPDDLKKVTGATMQAIDQYHSVFLSAEKPESITYTYGNRLMRYPTPVSGNLNQIEEVIVAQFRKSPDTRRAVATTMVPWLDKDSDEPPCITQVQAIQANNQLHFLVTVRSHDIFKAAIPNAFGLRMLQKIISDQLGFSLGALQITSQSAHIYESDWDAAKKLARCFYWDRQPEMVFDPVTMADPRGNFLIKLSAAETNEKGQDRWIEVVLQSPTGEELWIMKAKRAIELAKKIAQLELVSRSDHLADISMELQKAEIALLLGLDYNQDNELSLDELRKD